MTRLLPLFLLAMLGLAASAQPVPGGPPGPPGTPSQVPVDGGLGLLALAGGAYAVRRLRRPPAE